MVAPAFGEVPAPLRAGPFARAPGPHEPPGYGGLRDSGHDNPLADNEGSGQPTGGAEPVSYTHLRAHETSAHL
eukprot:1661990-Alexandrium_andersonii.AAC.1